MDPNQKKRISVKDLISTFIVLGLFAGIFYMGHYATSEISQLDAKNKTLLQEYEDMKNEIQSLKSINTQLLQEKNDLTAQIATLTQNQKEQELIDKGIDIQKVDIKKIGLSGSWEVSNFSYSLVSAYLTPIISDLTNYEVAEDLKDMHFLIVEVNVTDSRSSGNAIKIPLTDYATLIDGNLSLQPFTDDNMTILPKGQEKVFIGFAVEPLSYQFKLRSGYGSNPITNDLDFEGEQVENLNGVFMLSKGYADEYSQ